MNRNKIIYHVKLHEPIEGKADFFFSSITAIYNAFTAEQVRVATKFCIVKK